MSELHEAVKEGSKPKAERKGFWRSTFDWRMSPTELEGETWRPYRGRWVMPRSSRRSVMPGSRTNTCGQRRREST